MFCFFFVGYIVFYTNDTTKRDRDWSVEAVVGDVHKFVIRNLKTNSVYFFKVQARTDRTNGPFSAMVSYKTPRGKPIFKFKYSIHLFFFFIIFLL